MFKNLKMLHIVSRENKLIFEARRVGENSVVALGTCPAAMRTCLEMLGSNVQIQLNQIQREVSVSRECSVFPQLQVK